MRLHEIEAWALAVADRVVDCQPVEDDRVELKSTFIDPYKAARRIAGHANASRGSLLLWLIGIDDDAGTVPGVIASDFADWWAQTRSQFNEVAPEVQVVNVPFGRVTVVALLIRPDRVPFAVMNPAHGKTGGGPVELEVPWREGTAIRSARRSDLVRLLVPTVSTPQIEVLNASITVRDERSRLSDASGYREQDSVWLSVTFYIEHYSAEPLIIPDHRASAEVRNMSGETLLAAANLELGASGIRRTFGPSGIGHEQVRLTVERGAGQLLVHGSGLAVASKELHLESAPKLPEQESLEMRIFLNAVRLERQVCISTVVCPEAIGDAQFATARWTIGAEE